VSKGVPRQKLGVFLKSGRRVTSYMDHTAVAEFRGGQVLDRADLVNALKATSWEIIAQPQAFH